MSAYTAGQRDYCAAQQGVGALLQSGNRSRQFMVIRNCLVFDFIGTTTLYTGGIGDADAAQKWSHAYLLPVMTPDDKGMAKSEVQTALVQATFALRKPDELDRMKVQGRHVAHDRAKSDQGGARP